MRNLLQDRSKRPTFHVLYILQQLLDLAPRGATNRNFFTQVWKNDSFVQ